MTHLLRLIFVFTAGRTVVNMTRRFAYPFIPAIARRLNTPVGSIQTALALSWGVGLFSPVFGTLSERHGRKPIMVASLLAMALISLLGAFVPQFWAFAVVVIAYGIAKMIFDPALQAYVGDRVPFAQRGRVWGAVELSWSFAIFIAAPVTGLLLDSVGLQPVFALLFVLLALSALLYWRLVPDSEHPDSAASTPVKAARPPIFRLLRQRPLVFAALGYSVCMIAAQEIFFINYGLWMEDSFALVLATLGAVTIVLGVAEACGELLVSSIGDRVGMHRLALYGALAAGVGFALIPYAHQSLVLALAGIFVAFLMLEMAIVASITLYTEVLPEARSVMMSANISAMSLGRLIGALLGGSVYALTGNFPLVGLLAMVIMLVGCGSIWLLRAGVQSAAVCD